MRLKNAGSVDRTSSNAPCLLQALRIRTRPASSTIQASTTPGRGRKSETLALPVRTASTANRLQCGHRDCVRLGTPSGGPGRSELVASGPGAHVGVGLLRRGNIQQMFCGQEPVVIVSDRFWVRRLGGA